MRNKKRTTLIGLCLMFAFSVQSQTQLTNMACGAFNLASNPKDFVQLGDELFFYSGTQPARLITQQSKLTYQVYCLANM